jgi:Flp pilus assembly protein CpaB
VHLVSQFRLATARHRSVVRACLVVGVAAVGLALWSAAASVDAERQRWGDTTTVLVALRPLSPGETVTTADVRLDQWPVALAPQDAAPSLDEIAQVRQRVGLGEVLTTHDLSPRVGPSGLLPKGARGVVIPLGDDLRAALAVGDAVEVVVAGSAVGSGPVIAIGLTTALVGLPPAAAAGAADGVLLGTVTIMLVGDP